MTFDTRPNWVLFGAQIGGECIIWASDTLVQIDIDREWYPDITQVFSPVELPRIVATDVRLKLREFTVARGATWQEAFANLFNGGQWNPDRRPEEIGEGQRAIER